MPNGWYLRIRGNSVSLHRPDGRAQKDPRLAALGAALRLGAVTLERAKLQARQILEEYRPAREAPVFASDNLRLLEDYWRQEGCRRPRRDPYAARHRLEIAVRAVGALSLYAAPIADLQDAVNRLPPAIQRRRVGALNQLLRWARRPERLYPARLPQPAPVSLSLAEVLAILPTLPEQARPRVAVAFATGCRLGELWGSWTVLDRPQGLYVRVVQTWLRSGRAGPRKNGKQATPRVVPELADYVRAWNPAGPPPPGWTRSAELLAPHGVTFHNLRHSYARYWAERGASLTQLSLWLGDSYAVVESSYRGWSLEVA